MCSFQETKKRTIFLASFIFALAHTIFFCIRTLYVYMYVHKCPIWRLICRPSTLMNLELSEKTRDFLYFYLDRAIFIRHIFYSRQYTPMQSSTTIKVCPRTHKTYITITEYSYVRTYDRMNESIVFPSVCLSGAKRQCTLMTGRSTTSGGG